MQISGGTHYTHPAIWLKSTCLGRVFASTCASSFPRTIISYTISRAKGLVRRRATVWAIPITKPLPAIPIPLRGDDPDALLDLQQVLNTAYERGAYDVDIDYTRDPVPPLTAEQAEWARQTIATARHA